MLGDIHRRPARQGSLDLFARSSLEVFVRDLLHPVKGLKNLKCVTMMYRSTRSINCPTMMVFTHNGFMGPIEHGFQYTSNLPAAWVIYHNLGLQSFGFTTFQLFDSFSSCRIIRAITRLQSLRQLKCSIRDYSIVPVEVVLALPKGLPPSVEPIMVDSGVDINNNYHSLLVGDDGSDMASSLLEEGVGAPSSLNDLKIPFHLVAIPTMSSYGS